MSVPAAEIMIDEARAADWISAAFPELRGAAVEAMGAGFDNAAFVVDRRWVFRLPRRAAAVPFLRREIELLPTLAETSPLPISAPTLIADGAPGFPFPFAGYPLLPGTPASQREAHPDLGTELGELLRWLHDVDVDHPGDPVVQGLGKHDPVVARRQLDERLTRLDVDPVPIRRAADGLGDAPIDPERRWVHGDLYPRHLLLDEAGQLAGVIDWGDLHRGEIALDLSLAYGWLDPDARSRFFEVYGEIEEPVARRARFLALWYGVALSDLGAHPGLEDLGPVGARYLAHVLEG